MSLSFFALLLMLVGGCSCRRRAEVETVAPAPPPAAPRLAGSVVDGVFIDERWGFRLPIPPGWVANPGVDEGLLRVSLTQSSTGTRVEIWAFEGLTTELRPRGDCTWTFTDRARYRAVGGVDMMTTGTCTPDEPFGARVYGWLVPGRLVTYQAEIHVPGHALVGGRRDGEQVVRGLDPGL